MNSEWFRELIADVRQALDVVHPRTAGALLDRGPELGDRVVAPFGDDFYAAVGPV
jgi:hypothetical protein